MNAFLSNMPKRVLRPFQYNFALLIAVYQKHYMVKDTCSIHSSLLKLFFGPFSTSICYMNFALHSKSEPTWLFDAVNPLLINIYLMTIIEAKKASLFAVNVCFR